MRQLRRPSWRSPRRSSGRPPRRRMGARRSPRAPASPVVGCPPRRSPGGLRLDAGARSSGIGASLRRERARHDAETCEGRPERKRFRATAARPRASKDRQTRRPATARKATERKRLRTDGARARARKTSGQAGTRTTAPPSRRGATPRRVRWGKVAEVGRTSGRQTCAFRPRETRSRAARASRYLPRPRPLEARRGTPAHANSAQDVKGFYYIVS